MRKFLMTVALGITALAVQAENPLWVRQSSISPDGKTVVFSYQGNLFTVPATGGDACQLTTNPAYDCQPVWSPDGSRIAFASDREGVMSVYVVDAKGGVPTKLLNSPFTARPITWLDNEHVLYQSTVRPSTEDMEFPGSRWNQVYSISVKGGRPVMISSMPMENISINAKGEWLYNDWKGYEDEMRKHHTSSITRDIWKYDPKAHTYQKLTTFQGEDRNPIWAEGDSYYYLSEKNGSMNIYKTRIGSTTSTPVSQFTKHPVRYLSRANDGTLCFSFNGELYTLKDGEGARKININVIADKQNKDLIQSVMRSGAREFAVAPSGKEVAFVLHGDVYVTSVEYNTTRQITDTPDQERNVDFAPDGKSIVYASERQGLWQVYQARIKDADVKQLVYAKNIEEKNISNSDQTSFQPKFSPDGKKVAFLENRTTLKVVDLASGKVNTAMEGKWEYSYSDGDQDFSWSPDSRWLLSQYIGVGGWNNTDLALVKADGSEIHNLTESGYSDSNGKFVLEGKALLWSSDRAGYRSHGSWGAEDDYYIMFFDIDAMERFQMSKEEVALLDEAEKEEKKEEKTDGKDVKKDSRKAPQKDEKKDEAKPLTFDLKNAKYRIIRLTNVSAQMGDAIFDKKGETLYYVAGGQDGRHLWKTDLKERRSELVEKNVGFGLKTDKEKKFLFYSAGGGIKKLEIGKSGAKSVNFEAIFNYRPAQERAYIFDHVWRQVNEKFYDPTIRDIDWKEYHDNYARFLPYITNNYDFAELLSELLGELNGSHTGARFYPSNTNLSVGVLGLFYDDTYTGNGLKIKEIINKSPLTQKKNDVKAGCIIEKIDGVEIDNVGNENFLLAGKVGKKVTLGIYDPQTGKRFDVEMKPISNSAEKELLYDRWVERNRKIVEEKSEGKVGYIHIKSMDSPSFRTLYHEALGKYRNTKAIIVDTRHNGGGWLHDDVCTLLSGKEYIRYTPRGQFIGRDPYNKYTGKSCMLVCEDNYSNAHGTPWLYKELGVGKLIGTPVPGTMTAVWWETQIDNSIVFGIPMVGAMDNRGQYLENQQLEPDITIYNNPADVLSGKDAQLEGAIEEMLKEIGEK